MNVEKKLKAYVDKVEQKYEDFSMKDKLNGYKKDVIHALNEIDRSRSNSPSNDLKKEGGSGAARSRSSDHSSDDESTESMPKPPKFRKSNSHTTGGVGAESAKVKDQNIKKRMMSGMKGFFKFSKTKEEE